MTAGQPAHLDDLASVDPIDWFRAASPYINAHRDRTLVLCLPGDLIDSDHWTTLTHDLALLSHLGMRLVLCFGLRAQVNADLAERHRNSAIVDGRRVTDEAALEAIITMAGRVRTRLESHLSMGLPNTPMRGARLSVSSGNFTIARPFGVHDGVDFLHTGSVREVNATAVRHLLELGHIVLMPPLGHSLTGEVFNLAAEDVAVAAAASLGADKLVFFPDKLPRDDKGRPLRQASATRLESGSRLADIDEVLGQTLEHAIDACRRGVDRVHLLDRGDRDALLRELFTVDGSGTLITAERWEKTRAAHIDDVGGLIELIAPLQANGTLVGRSREQLELDIGNFRVSERDGRIVACAALYLDIGEADTSGGSAEIACVATHPDYRGHGRADRLLEELESAARLAGCRQVLLLTTRTAHWFIERGYREVGPDALPDARRTRYSHSRKSKVYRKPL